MASAREPLRDIAHLGHVELLTPEPEASLRNFTEMLGMDEVHREGRSSYLRGYGDYAVTTLKLSEAARAGVGHVGWRAASPDALARRVEAIERAGLGLGWSNGDFGHGEAYRFRDPDGHTMEIDYSEERYVAPDGKRSTLLNLPIKYPAHGVGVRRLDHLALLCREVAPNRAFIVDSLDLQLREQVDYERGTKEIGSWLSSTPVHHEVAYVVDVKGQSGRLHHLSLWADNRSDILRAADIFRENGVHIETGPSKHNNSQAFYLYAYEPGGNRIEFYTGGFLVFAPDFEPVVWDEETRGPGVYWGAALPETFLNYATPDVTEP